MESHDINHAEYHAEYQTGECHSSTWEGTFSEMKASTEAQTARFYEFSRRTEQQLFDLNTALQIIIAQTSGKRKRSCKYSDVDLPVEKRTRTSVECLQQETCGSRTLVKC